MGPKHFNQGDCSHGTCGSSQRTVGWLSMVVRVSLHFSTQKGKLQASSTKNVPLDRCDALYTVCHLKSAKASASLYQYRTVRPLRAVGTRSCRFSSELSGSWNPSRMWAERTRSCRETGRASPFFRWDCFSGVDGLHGENVASS